MNINTDAYSLAIKMALRTKFLSSSQELKLYANALYSAMIWGREVDEKHKAIRERDTSVK